MELSIYVESFAEILLDFTGYYAAVLPISPLGYESHEDERVATDPRGSLMIGLLISNNTGRL